jgi:hypothetical protein
MATARNAISVKQNSLVAGLIDEKCQERSDLQLYSSSAFVADNVLVRAQGGMSRRFGMRHIDMVPNVPLEINPSLSISTPNGGDGTKLFNGDLFDYFITTTTIRVTDGYIAFSLMFKNGTTYVDMFDICMASMDKGQLNNPYVESNEWQIQILENSVWSNAKSFFITSQYDESYRARISKNISGIRVIRVGTNDYSGYFFQCGGIKLWIETGQSQLNRVRLQPVILSYENNYMLLITDYSARVYMGGILVSEIPMPQVMPSQIEQLKFSSFGPSLVLTHQDVNPLIIQRYKTDSLWRIFPIEFENIPVFDMDPKTDKIQSRISAQYEYDTNNEILDVKLTVNPLDQGVFLATDVGASVSGAGGRCWIVSVVDAKHVIGYVINSFEKRSQYLSGWTINRSSMPLWGEENGYPECSGFFSSRLWFGGFKNAPNVIAASVIGDYFNFDEGTQNDDDALVVMLSGGNESHRVRFMQTMDTFEILSETGIFSIKKFDSGSITSLISSFFFRKPIGIEPYLAPFRVEDGGTLFFKIGRNDIRELKYDDSSYSYDARSISAMFSSYIDGVKSYCVVRSRDVDISNQVLVVNGSGEICCITFLLSEEVIAATRWKTAGEFVCTGATIHDAYVVTKRGIDGKLILEKVDGDAFLDSEVVYVNSTGGQLTGLVHLIGQTVQVRADAEYLGEFIVDANASIEIPNGNWSKVLVGLGFRCEIVPASPDVGEGTTLSNLWKSYYHAVISVYDTQFLQVDGYDMEFLGRNFNQFNQTPLLGYTGRYRVELGNDPSLTPTIRIASNFPLSFNVRSITYKMDAN